MPIPGSYLAGGTALALILGHRESLDFDWFSPEEFDPDVLIRRLSQLGKIVVSDVQRGTFHGLLDGVRLTWLYYPNPLLDDFIQAEEMPGLKLASLLDIGLMKWTAVSQRGARKDFIDLYMICHKQYSLDTMAELFPKKYPGVDVNLYHMIKSLSYFDDAEREPMPRMLIHLPWPVVKSYFLNEQKKLLQKYAG
ncbi:MAG: nucleotidyl transferase AbiEii/AbiGii toxin family protein [Firmicutes bacterium]|jgi:hypothetical protein|nr:nucleotidyl transferase AbiEii/AbiGii toxin family protein [Bacillota bacterium]